MEPAEFRLPTLMREQAQQQADRDGTSFSEFVRQSVAFRLAWLAAIDTIAAGAPPSSLTDIERLARTLAAISAGGSP
jgi:hypothetical protein